MDAALDTDPELDLWVLVASRSISEQVRVALEAHARNLAISVGFLDYEPHDLTALPALCAKFPELTVQTLASDAESRASLTALLENIRQHPAFARVDAETLSVFSADHLGYATLRASLSRRFELSVREVPTSRIQFGQIVLPLAQDAIDLPRTAVDAGLDEWWHNWPSHGRIAVLHGEEGTGKTWDLASWIERKNLRHDDSPLVIWRNSDKFTFDSLVALGAHYIRAASPSEQPIEKRLRQWASANSTPPWPRVLLVVDGLNERPSHNEWRRWLAAASHELQHWLPAAALILTCRSSFWLPLHEHFRDELHSRPVAAGNEPRPSIHEIAVESFTDPELDQILTLYGRAPRNLDPRLRDLLRRPRHLRLAIRNWERNLQAGDFTVERLFFDDWRDRMSGRDRQPLTDDEFQRLLKEVATIWRGNLSTNELAQLLAGNQELSTALEALTSGGVFERVHGSPGDLRLEPNRLFLGLGFFLLEQVARKGGGHLDTALEAAVAYTESAGESDESARILANAICIALTDRGPHAAMPNVALALLLALVRHRNGAEYWERAQPWAYFPDAPTLFQDLAEEEWANRESRSSERVGYCFAWIGEKWPTHEALIGTCHRWLSLVHAASARSRYAQNDDAIAEYQHALPDRLREMEPLTEPLGLSPILVPNETLLRLKDLAFLVISQAIVEVGWIPSYLGSLGAWAVSSAVTGHVRGAREAEWVVRLAGRRCGESVIDLADQLATRPEPLLQLAAAILLNAEASPDSRAAGARLDVGRPSRLQAAPATFATASGSLADLSPAEAADTLTREALDPRTPMDGIAWQYEQLMESIDIADLCVGRMATGADLLLSRTDLALSRTAPAAYARMARRQIEFLLRELPAGSDLRTDLLAEHFLLLTRDHLSEARDLLHDIENRPTPASGWDARVGWNLACVVLAGLATAEEQQQFLLSRIAPSDDDDWGDLLAPLSAGDVDRMIRQLPDATGVERRRLLWPRWSEPFTPTDDQRAKLLDASRDRGVGVFAAYPAQRARDPQLLFAAIADGGIDDEVLSQILERQFWARSALATSSRWPGGAPEVGLQARSWLISHEGLSSDAVREWVGKVDEALRGRMGRGSVSNRGIVAVDTLEAAIQVAPETVGLWVDALASRSGLFHRLFDLHFGLVAALITALLNLDDERGISSLSHLLQPQMMNFNDSSTGISSLWFVPFKARETPAAVRAATKLFHLALNDNDLQKLAFVAARAERLPSLVEAIPLSDEHLLVTDRLAALVALSPHTPWAAEYVETFARSAQGPQVNQAKWALDMIRRDQWARHWFHRFAHVADRTAAWAAFRLFQKAADRRWLLWYGDELDSAKATHDIDARRRHYALNREALLTVTKESWDKADKTLFGEALPSADMLPWKNGWHL
jgi:hypothetical protein